MNHRPEPLWPANVRSRGPRHRITFIAALSYALFCSTHLLDDALPRNVSGEWTGLLEMTSFLWPYPLLLALQTIVSPNSLVNSFIADLLGFSIVLVVALLLERALGPRAQRRWVAISLGLISWPIALALFEIVVWALATHVLGWPTGE